MLGYCEIVGLCFLLVVLVVTLICQAVALIVLQASTLAFVGFFTMYAFVFTYLFFLYIRMSKSAEHTQGSETIINPIEDAPPSYEGLFKLYTNPPPYEVATKENWKDMIVQDLQIVCFE